MSGATAASGAFGRVQPRHSPLDLDSIAKAINGFKAWGSRSLFRRRYTTDGEEHSWGRENDLSEASQRVPELRARWPGPGRGLSATARHPPPARQLHPHSRPGPSGQPW